MRENEKQVAEVLEQYFRDVYHEIDYPEDNLESDIEDSKSFAIDLARHLDPVLEVMANKCMCQFHITSVIAGLHLLIAIWSSKGDTQMSLIDYMKEYEVLNTGDIDQEHFMYYLAGRPANSTRASLPLIEKLYKLLNHDQLIEHITNK
jgi:hypothetical protein